jgi:AbrB family looped-hinge helix DNA binding protein
VGALSGSVTPEVAGSSPVAPVLEVPACGDFSFWRDLAAPRTEKALAEYLYWYSKGMARISAKNQVTIPVAVLEEAGLRAGDHVVVEALEAGELRIRRGELGFERAFGVLTGTFPRDYLERLDQEDAER